MKKIFIFIIVSFLFLIFIGCNQNDTNYDTFTPGKIIIKFKSNNQKKLKTNQSISNIDKIDNLLKDYYIDEISPLIKKSDIEKVKRFQSSKKVLESLKEIQRIITVSIPEIDVEETNSIVNYLNNQSDIEYAEPDYKGSFFYTPNDDLYSLQWGVRRTEIDKAWDYINQHYPNRESVKVAVVDSGVNYNHPDLIDVIHKRSTGSIMGKDVYFETNDPDDEYGHGTAVASIIAASCDNIIGTAGVATCVSDIKIIPIKIGNADGQITNSDTARGIWYAVYYGAHIINASWGFTYHSKSIYDMIKYAKNRDVLIVAAAGNSALDIDSDKIFPAAYELDNIISVANSNTFEKLVVNSNYGDYSVDLAAPGGEGHSLSGDSTPVASIGNTYNNFFGGTSAAAPHVAGVAAMLKSIHPSWTYAQIKERILKSVTLHNNYTYKVLTGGRLNAYNAVKGTITISTLPILLSIPKVDIEYPIQNANILASDRLTIRGYLENHESIVNLSYYLYRDYSFVDSGSISVERDFDFNIDISSHNTAPATYMIYIQAKNIHNMTYDTAASFTIVRINASAMPSIKILNLPEYNNSSQFSLFVADKSPIEFYAASHIRKVYFKLYDYYSGSYIGQIKYRKDLHAHDCSLPATVNGYDVIACDFLWDTTRFYDGKYKLKFIAYDNENNSQTKYYQFLINNN